MPVKRKSGDSPLAIAGKRHKPATRGKRTDNVLSILSPQEITKEPPAKKTLIAEPEPESDPQEESTSKTQGKKVDVLSILNPTLRRRSGKVDTRALPPQKELAQNSDDLKGRDDKEQTESLSDSSNMIKPKAVDAQAEPHSDVSKTPSQIQELVQLDRSRDFQPATHEEIFDVLSILSPPKRKMQQLAEKPLIVETEPKSDPLEEPTPKTRRKKVDVLSPLSPTLSTRSGKVDTRALPPQKVAQNFDDLKGRDDKEQTVSLNNSSNMIKSKAVDAQAEPHSDVSKTPSQVQEVVVQLERLRDFQPATRGEIIDVLSILRPPKGKMQQPAEKPLIVETEPKSDPPEEPTPKTQRKEVDVLSPLSHTLSRRSGRVNTRALPPQKVAQNFDDFEGRDDKEQTVSLSDSSNMIKPKAVDAQAEPHSDVSKTPSQIQELVQLERSRDFQPATRGEIIDKLSILSPPKRKMQQPAEKPLIVETEPKSDPPEEPTPRTRRKKVDVLSPLSHTLSRRSGKVDARTLPPQKVAQNFDDLKGRDDKEQTVSLSNSSKMIKPKAVDAQAEPHSDVSKTPSQIQELVQLERSRDFQPATHGEIFDVLSILSAPKRKMQQPAEKPLIVETQPKSDPLEEPTPKTRRKKVDVLSALSPTLSTRSGKVDTRALPPQKVAQNFDDLKGRADKKQTVSLSNSLNMIKPKAVEAQAEPHSDVSKTPSQIQELVQLERSIDFQPATRGEIIDRLSILSPPKRKMQQPAEKPLIVDTEPKSDPPEEPTPRTRIKKVDVLSPLSHTLSRRSGKMDARTLPPQKVAQNFDDLKGRDAKEQTVSLSNSSKMIKPKAVDAQAEPHSDVSKTPSQVQELVVQLERLRDFQPATRGEIIDVLSILRPPKGKMQQPAEKPLIVETEPKSDPPEEPTPKTQRKEVDVLSPLSHTLCRRSGRVNTRALPPQKVARNFDDLKERDDKEQTVSLSDSSNMIKPKAVDAQAEPHSDVSKTPSQIQELVQLERSRDFQPATRGEIIDKLSILSPPKRKMQQPAEKPLIVETEPKSDPPEQPTPRTGRKKVDVLSPLSHTLSRRSGKVDARTLPPQKVAQNFDDLKGRDDKEQTVSLSNSSKMIKPKAVDAQAEPHSDVSKTPSQIQELVQLERSRDFQPATHGEIFDVLSILSPPKRNMQQPAEKPLIVETQPKSDPLEEPTLKTRRKKVDVLSALSPTLSTRSGKVDTQALPPQKVAQNFDDLKGRADKKQTVSLSNSSNMIKPKAVDAQAEPHIDVSKTPSQIQELVVQLERSKDFQPTTRGEEIDVLSILSPPKRKMQQPSEKTLIVETEPKGYPPEEPTPKTGGKKVDVLSTLSPTLSRRSGKVDTQALPPQKEPAQNFDDLKGIDDKEQTVSLNDSSYMIKSKSVDAQAEPHSDVSKAPLQIQELVVELERSTHIQQLVVQLERSRDFQPTTRGEEIDVLSILSPPKRKMPQPAEKTLIVETKPKSDPPEEPTPKTQRKKVDVLSTLSPTLSRRSAKVNTQALPPQKELAQNFDDLKGRDDKEQTVSLSNSSNMIKSKAVDAQAEPHGDVSKAPLQIQELVVELERSTQIQQLVVQLERSRDFQPTTCREEIDVLSILSPSKRKKQQPAEKTLIVETEPKSDPPEEPTPKTQRKKVDVLSTLSPTLSRRSVKVDTQVLPPQNELAHTFDDLKGRDDKEQTVSLSDSSNMIKSKAVDAQAGPHSDVSKAPLLIQELVVELERSTQIQELVVQLERSRDFQPTTCGEEIDVLSILSPPKRKMQQPSQKTLIVETEPKSDPPEEPTPKIQIKKVDVLSTLSPTLSRRSAKVNTQALPPQKELAQNFDDLKGRDDKEQTVSLIDSSNMIKSKAVDAQAEPHGDVSKAPLQIQELVVELERSTQIQQLVVQLERSRDFQPTTRREEIDVLSILSPSKRKKQQPAEKTFIVETEPKSDPREEPTPKTQRKKVDVPSTLSPTLSRRSAKVNTQALPPQKVAQNFDDLKRRDDKEQTVSLIDSSNMIKSKAVYAQAEPHSVVSKTPSQIQELVQLERSIDCQPSIHGERIDVLSILRPPKRKMQLTPKKPLIVETEPKSDPPEDPTPKTRRKKVDVLSTLSPTLSRRSGKVDTRGLPPQKELAQNFDDLKRRDDKKQTVSLSDSSNMIKSKPVDAQAEPQIDVSKIPSEIQEQVVHLERLRDFQPATQGERIDALSIPSPQKRKNQQPAKKTLIVQPEPKSDPPKESTHKTRRNKVDVLSILSPTLSRRSGKVDTQALPCQKELAQNFDDLKGRDDKKQTVSLSDSSNMIKPKAVDAQAEPHSDASKTPSQINELVQLERSRNFQPATHGEIIDVLSILSAQKRRKQKPPKKHLIVETEPKSYPPEEATPKTRRKKIDVLSILSPTLSRRSGKVDTRALPPQNELAQNFDDFKGRDDKEQTVSLSDSSHIIKSKAIDAQAEPLSDVSKTPSQFQELVVHLERSRDFELATRGEVIDVLSIPSPPKKKMQQPAKKPLIVETEPKSDPPEEPTPKTRRKKLDVLSTISPTLSRRRGKVDIQALPPQKVAQNFDDLKGGDDKKQTVILSDSSNMIKSEAIDAQAEPHGDVSKAPLQFHELVVQLERLRGGNSISSQSKCEVNVSRKDFTKPVHLDRLGNKNDINSVNSKCETNSVDMSSEKELPSTSEAVLQFVRLNRRSETNTDRICRPRKHLLSKNNVPVVHFDRLNRNDNFVSGHSKCEVTNQNHDKDFPNTAKLDRLAPNKNADFVHSKSEGNEHSDNISTACWVEKDLPNSSNVPVVQLHRLPSNKNVDIINSEHCNDINTTCQPNKLLPDLSKVPIMLDSMNDVGSVHSESEINTHNDSCQPEKDLLNSFRLPIVWLDMLNSRSSVELPENKPVVMPENAKAKLPDATAEHKNHDNQVMSLSFSNDDSHSVYRDNDTSFGSEEEHEDLQMKNMKAACRHEDLPNDTSFGSEKEHEDLQKKNTNKINIISDIRLHMRLTTIGSPSFFDLNRPIENSPVINGALALERHEKDSSSEIISSDREDDDNDPFFGLHYDSDNEDNSNPALN